MKLNIRIYDKKQQQMLYAQEPHEQGKREYYPFVFEIGFSHWKQDDLSEPMLATGYKDKHGKEIYEGDIVIADWCWTKPHAIIWPHDCYYFIEFVLDGNIEIIGNIHDNPELIP